MATVQNENSGMGVIIGILIAVLLAVGAYFLIKQNDTVDTATPVVTTEGTPAEVNVDATVNPAPTAPEVIPAPDAGATSPTVDEDTTSSTTTTDSEGNTSTTTTTTE